MIAKQEVIPILLKASPAFRKTLDAHPTKELLYSVLGDFAGHLLDLYKAGQYDTLKTVGIAIEELHLNGDNYVREVATIGLLEGIQNVWGNSKVDPELFKPYLLPTSVRWWDELNSFWNGERLYVGEGLATKLSAEDIAKNREAVTDRIKTRRA